MEIKSASIGNHYERLAQTLPAEALYMQTKCLPNDFEFLSAALEQPHVHSLLAPQYGAELTGRLARSLYRSLLTPEVTVQAVEIMNRYHPGVVDEWVRENDLAARFLRTALRNPTGDALDNLRVAEARMPHEDGAADCLRAQFPDGWKRYYQALLSQDEFNAFVNNPQVSLRAKTELGTICQLCKGMPALGAQKADEFSVEYDGSRDMVPETLVRAALSLETGNRKRLLRCASYLLPRHSDHSSALLEYSSELIKFGPQVGLKKGSSFIGRAFDSLNAMLNLPLHEETQAARAFVLGAYVHERRMDEVFAAPDSWVNELHSNTAFVSLLQSNPELLEEFRKQSPTEIFGGLAASLGVSVPPNSSLTALSASAKSGEATRTPGAGGANLPR